MTRVLSIEDPEKKMFEMTHFIGYAKYENATLSLIPDIKLLQHFIFLQENFTKIPVITLLQLKNVYAIKMYNQIGLVRFLVLPIQLVFALRLHQVLMLL